MGVLLTAELLAEIRRPGTARHFQVFDSEVKGLYADCLSSGRIQFRLRYRINGKYRFATLGDADLYSVEQARDIARKILQDVLLGNDPKPKKNHSQALTFKVFFFNHYLPYVKSYKRSWMTDLSVINNQIQPSLGNKLLDDCTMVDFTQLVHAMMAKGYAPGTTNRVIILLRFAFKLAREWELIHKDHDPTRNLRPLKFDNRIERYLSQAQLDRLFSELARSENVLLPEVMAFLIFTGARKQEALRAKWVDVDMSQRLWRIPHTKSSKIRHVPLSNGALAILRRMKQNQPTQNATAGYIFGNPKTGKPFVSVFRSWDKARRRAQLPELRIHDLRHSFASFLVNAGRSLYEVQEILGHSDIRTTSRYAHLSRERLLEAVATVPEPQISINPG